MWKKKRQPDNPNTPAATPTPRRAVAWLRLAVFLVALAALVGVIATFAFRSDPSTENTADAVTYTTVPAPATGALAGEAFGTAGAGECLTWAAADAGDLAKVDCGQEHLFEVAATIDLSNYPGREFGPSGPYPGELRFGELRSEFCVAAVRGYLGTRYDPYGKFSVNLINPGAKGWAAGERTIRCGLQHVGANGQSFPVVGKVADQEQARIFEPGACVGIVADIPADPVPCDQPHAYEIVALVDLAQEFPGGFPALADQDRYLSDRCNTLTAEYLGGPERLGQLTLTPFWENIRLASWVSGARKVNCAIGAQVQTGGFASITGTAKGEILLNGQPPRAPAATTTPAPAPAPPR